LLAAANVLFQLATLGAYDATQANACDGLKGHMVVAVSSLLCAAAGTKSLPSTVAADGLKGHMVVAVSSLLCSAAGRQ